ncbi:hypothetical protein [Hahella ganghwensis]|uniref:hypothetical protein n=1 Tax=Hahella ganghwensis TaxID=286420 RepID=UPI0003A2BC49|nr:hypothetical protein [Hahella ganghwensis]
MEALVRKSGAKIYLTPDITVNSEGIVTDVGGAQPEGRTGGITYTPFSNPLGSERQKQLAVKVLGQVIHELDMTVPFRL